MSGRTSVIIPCYNVQDYLGHALDSVKIQSAPVLEVVLVDDGSKVPLQAPADWTGPALRLLRTPNRGLAAARNLGISQARGEFLAFLDADDFWHPEKIARQEQALDANAQAIACYTRCVRAPGFFAFGPYPPADVSDAEFLLVLWYHSFFPPSSVLVRKEVSAKVGGFQEGMGNGEDVEWFVRLLRAGRFVQVQQELTWYRVHAQQFTADAYRKLNGFKEARQIMIARSADLLMAAGIPRERLWQAYRENILTVYYRRDFAAARRLLWEYWRAHPDDLQIFFYAVLSLLPASLVRSLRGSISAPATEPETADRWQKTCTDIRRSLGQNGSGGV